MQFIGPKYWLTHPQVVGPCSKVLDSLLVPCQDSWAVFFHDKAFSSQESVSSFSSDLFHCCKIHIKTLLLNHIKGTVQWY